MPAFRRPQRKYSQAERVVALYDMLHRGAALRPERDGEQFGVGRRTLERDLAVLGGILGPRLERVEEPGVGVVYRLPPAARRWKLTPWQLLAVGVGTRMTGFLSGRRFSTEIQPLLEQFKQSLLPGERARVGRLERKIHVVGTGQKDYRSNPAAQERLVTFLEGLLVEKPVALEYLSHEQRAAGRGARRLVVHPLSLVIYRGAVYFIVDIVAGDWDRPERRIQLALDRVGRAEVDQAAESFVYPKGFSAAEFLAGAFGIFGGRDRHRVVLAVDPSYAPYVAERFWHATQELSAEPGGALRLRFTVARLEEVADWVLGMGEHVEVLEPAELRARVRERLEGALAQYRSGPRRTLSRRRAE